LQFTAVRATCQWLAWSMSRIVDGSPPRLGEAVVRLLVRSWLLAQAAPLLPRGRHPYPHGRGPSVTPGVVRHQRHEAPCTCRAVITKGRCAVVVTIWPIGPGSIGQI